MNRWRETRRNACENARKIMRGRAMNNQADNGGGLYSILKSWHKSRQNIRDRENNNWIDLSSIIRQEPRQHTHLIKIYRQNWLTDRADNGQSVLSIVKRWRDTRRNGWEYEAEQWTTQLTMAAVIRREPWLYTHLMKRVNRHNQQTWQNRWWIKCAFNYE